MKPIDLLKTEINKLTQELFTMQDTHVHLTTEIKEKEQLLENYLDALEKLRS